MLFADCGFILMFHDMSFHSLPHSPPPFTHVSRNKQPNAVVGTSLARHTSRGLASPPLLSDNTKLEVPSSICHNVGARSELDSSCARFSLFFAVCLFPSFFSRLPALEMQVLGLYCFNDTAFPVLRVRSIKMKTPKATGGGLDMSLQTSFNLGLLSQVKVSDVAKRY